MLCLLIRGGRYHIERSLFLTVSCGKNICVYIFIYNFKKIIKKLLGESIIMKYYREEKNI